MFGALLAAGASLAGGILARNSAKKAASTQYDRELYMSNTAHQREVKDLKAAGLNPILSANGGASTPSVSPSQPLDLSGTVGSALQGAAIKANIDQVKAATRTQETQQALNQVNAQLAIKQQQQVGANIKQIQAATTKIGREADILKPQAEWNTGQAGQITNAINNVAGAAGSVVGALNPFAGLLTNSAKALFSAAGIKQSSNHLKLAK